MPIFRKYFDVFGTRYKTNRLALEITGSDLVPYATAQEKCDYPQWRRFYYQIVSRGGQYRQHNFEKRDRL